MHLLNHDQQSIQNFQRAVHGASLFMQAVSELVVLSGAVELGIEFGTWQGHGLRPFNLDP